METLIDTTSKAYLDVQKSKMNYRLSIEFMTKEIREAFGDKYRVNVGHPTNSKVSIFIGWDDHRVMFDFLKNGNNDWELDKTERNLQYPEIINTLLYVVFKHKYHLKE